MQQLYRIIVKPYNFDHWDIFTEDKALFDLVSNYDSQDEAMDALGETWEVLVENDICVEFPYILLDETEMRQYD